MYLVTRTLHFCYGHRLLNYEGKCARLHGHNGRVDIEISSAKLNRQGMVMDFYEIQKALGEWLDRELDHRVILREGDPLVDVLRKAGEPVVTLKGNPTAEVMAKLIFDAARTLRLPVCRVTLWETENSAAVYHE
jgi:6-pyruvoyltetrahydropterin/6-carboxytetrahydropterin synthase